MNSEIKQLFTGNKTFGENKHAEIFQLLIPYLSQQFSALLDLTKIKSGRPRKLDFSSFFNAVFFQCQSGAQTRHIPKYSGIAKSTYLRYFEKLKTSRLLESINSCILAEAPLPNIFTTDTFTVKSMDGSEGTGRNPTDRGRRGIKVSLISDAQKVIRHVEYGAANVYDSNMLITTLKTQFPKRVRLYADSAYIGERISDHGLKHKARLIAQPRRTRGTKKTHILRKGDKEEMKMYRNGIEHNNCWLRRFRGIHNKWVKTMDSYRCLVFLAVLCINCYLIYVKN